MITVDAGLALLVIAVMFSPAITKATRQRDNTTG
jgi:hypothetical protein